MIIDFPGPKQSFDRPFYANYCGPSGDVIHLPPVYPLPPGERARQLRRWFNRRRPEPIVATEP